MSEESGVLGPAPNTKTREYKVRVKFERGTPPLTLIFNAESEGRAKLYARNRWPGCKEVEIV